jgi:hypothetical protein
MVVMGWGTLINVKQGVGVLQYYGMHKCPVVVRLTCTWKGNKMSTHAAENLMVQ